MTGPIVVSEPYVKWATNKKRGISHSLQNYSVPLTAFFFFDLTKTVLVR